MAARPGSVRIRRIAAASAAGSRCGTSRPGPSVSSSTACGKRRGDDGNAGGDGLDEDAGGDLLAGVVRAGRRRRRSGSAGPARRRRGSPARSRRRRRRRAARRAGAGRRGTPRRAARAPWGGSGRRRCTSGVGSRSRSRASARSAHSMPLPGPSSPQVSRCGRDAADGPVRGRGLGGAVRDDGDLGGVDVVADEQPVAGRAGHRHDRVRPRRRSAPARASGRGVGWASTVCSTTMLGTASRCSSGRTSRAVRAGIDAVLVLDDGHVEGVERVAPPPASRRAARPTRCARRRARGGRRRCRSVTRTTPPSARRRSAARPGRS